MLTLPATTLPAPPRRVRWIGPGRGVLWLARLLTLPFVAIGLFFLAVWVIGPFWVLYGTNHTAAVIYAETFGTGKKAEHKITYVYSLDGVERRVDDVVPEREFLRITGGASADAGPERPAYRPVTVRTLGRPPLLIERHLEPDESPWLQYIGYAVIGLVWNGIVQVFVRAIYLKPRQIRRLYTHGQADRCIITHKDTGRGKRGSNSYWIFYDYRFNGQTVSDKMIVRDKAAYDAASVGQPATVLHPPGKATPSVVYEFGHLACG